MDGKLETLKSVLPPNLLSERDGKPLLSPNKSEEISAITRYATEHSLAIEITGAGTKRSWGNPVTADLLLDTTHLTGVISHSWQDLTATVAAGTTWADMQRLLAQHNQFVALDPLWPERATVGGIIATNDSGPMRLKYGSLRDLIIGMTIILADGTIAKSGGKVVKNVAGYDLHKLMTGAFGTLGIITEVTFRLHPIPRHRQTFTVSAPQAAQLAPLMAAITDSHLLLEAMQLRGDPSGFHLDIQLNAHPDAKQPDHLKKMTEAVGLNLADPIAPKCENGGSRGLQAAEFSAIPNPGVSPGPLANVWQAREQLFEAEESFITKIGMLPTDIPPIADDIVRLGGTFAAQSHGLIYAAFPNVRRDYSALGSLYAYTDTGSMTVLRIPADPLDDPTPPWGPEKPNPLMREIKHQFDPNRILNPGRFLGGI